MQLTHTIQTSTIEKEGILKASKYQRVQMLLLKEELCELLTLLGPHVIIEHSKLLKESELLVSKESFLQRYEQYLEGMISGKMPRELLASLSLCISKSFENFYKIEVPGDRYLVKLKTPAITLQPFSFHFDQETKTIFTGVHSGERIYFGLEFSFPQFYETPKTRETVEILKNKENPETIIFKTIQSFARRQTNVTKIKVNKEIKNYSFRIGKSAHFILQKHQAMHTNALEPIC